MAMADPKPVIPRSFYPCASKRIDLLDRENSSNHRSDVGLFLLRQIFQPSAGEGQEPHTSAHDHWFPISIFREVHALNPEYNDWSQPRPNCARQFAIGSHEVVSGKVPAEPDRQGPLSGNAVLVAPSVTRTWISNAAISTGEEIWFSSQSQSYPRGPQQ